MLHRPDSHLLLTEDYVIGDGALKSLYPSVPNLKICSRDAQ